jgi:hypothetical protein
MQARMLLAILPLTLTSPAIAQTAAANPATGFPTNYSEEPQCVTEADLSRLKTAYLSKSMSPATRKLFTDHMRALPQVQIVTDASKADYLIDIDERGGQAQLSLMAVARKASGKQMGWRCEIMPHPGKDANGVARDMVLYMQTFYPAAAGTPTAITQAAMRSEDMSLNKYTGFPDQAWGGRYSNKMICDGYMDAEAINAGTKLFIANDTPDEVKSVIAKAMSQYPKYSIVQNSLEADFLLAFGQTIGTDVRTQPIYGYVSTSIERTDDGERSVVGGRPVIGTQTSTITYDVNTFTIFGIQHPQSGSGTGIICGLFGETASKARGLSGAFTKKPAKKLTEKLVKFFANPAADWLTYIPKDVRVRWRESGL